jgi:hypothetical protein
MLHTFPNKGGHFFLSNTPTDPTSPPSNTVPNNGAIHTVSNILKNVMSLATEAEFAGLFHNARDGAMLRTTLVKMGHPQPATPIQTDNSTASGITNGTVCQRKSKAMDICFIGSKIASGKASSWHTGDRD